jgi:hypothetical protein
MSTYSNPLDILNDKQVRVYFLGILESNLTSEEKYQKFLAFFAQQEQIEREMLRRTEQLLSNKGGDLNRILSQVGQEIGVWEPQKMLEETADSIKRAVRRLRVSQHRDGGWGPLPEQSNFWGTVYAVLCLLHTQTIKAFTFDVDIAAMLDRGIRWLRDKPYEWDATTIAANGMLSVYHTALAVRCFSQAGQTDFSAVPDGLAALADAQNADGGWDAHLWGPEIPSLTKVYSEVGATSYAIQALAETGDMQYADGVRRAIDWLLAMQNDDGSWNYGSCHPGTTDLSGTPDIKKTCEALQGILVGKTYSVWDATFMASIDKAVEWLQGQEKPIFDENKQIEGWGWFSSIFDYEVSCLTLETLVKMPDPPLTLLGSNVNWLIKSQCTDANRLENGSWLQGDTARITLSLIEYYKTISTSSLFE